MNWQNYSYSIGLFFGALMLTVIRLNSPNMEDDNKKFCESLITVLLTTSAAIFQLDKRD